MAEVLPEEVLYDVRLIERHIRRGLLTKETAQAHQDGLADVAEQADKIDLDHLANHLTGHGSKRLPSA